MAIKNISELRAVALSCLEDLGKGKITIEEAGATAKLCETVVSGCKLEMDYAKMLGKEPKISFLGDCTGKYTVEHQKKVKSLGGK